MSPISAFDAELLTMARRRRYYADSVYLMMFTSISSGKIPGRGPTCPINPGPRHYRISSSQIGQQVFQVRLRSRRRS